MKISSIVLVLPLLFFCGSTNAQVKQTATKTWQFQSINTIGLLDGQAGGALQLLTINGLQHRSWFWGIGTGIDEYRLKSVPLFADIRKRLTRNFFAYTDAGFNWYWQKPGDVKQFYISDKFKTGLYGEAGLGYMVQLHRGLSMLFSGAYSFKKLTEQGDDGWGSTAVIFPVTTSSSSSINYHLNRMAIKAGIAF